VGHGSESQSSGFVDWICYCGIKVDNFRNPLIPSPLTTKLLVRVIPRTHPQPDEERRCWGTDSPRSGFSSTAGASPGIRTCLVSPLPEDLARLAGKLGRIPATASPLAMVAVSEAAKTWRIPPEAPRKELLKHVRDCFRQMDPFCLWYLNLLHYRHLIQATFLSHNQFRKN